MFSFTTVHESFKFNGTPYAFKDLQTLAQCLIKTQVPYKKDIGKFLLQWQDRSPSIILKTSGSTGIPKTMTISKQAMVNSAIATGMFFNLKPGNSALLCLPAHYIAGKMMLVRALILGLELDSIAPKSNLKIASKKQYHFAAMVPMQVKNNLDQLNTINKLIVGGVKVSLDLINRLKVLKTSVFETYGMTETVSHIAVRQLNHNSAKTHFKTLPKVEISQDAEDCLIIHAPSISKIQITTNDVVKLYSKNEFEWLGRRDTIINSGGIKIFPEQVENLLSGKIKHRFFIASEADKTLGERVILVIEGLKLDLKDSLFNTLEKHNKPKKIYTIPKFIETSSGKIQRQKTLTLLA